MADTIVTGQQIGLLGGPLYTTCKVLGTAALARESGGRAIYWLETNDADFEEINHITILNREHRLVTHRWELDTGGRSTGTIPVTGELVVLLNRVFDDLPETSYTADLRRLALDCYRPGTSLGEASMELARQLYGRFGVEPFDPSSPAFLQAVRPILEKASIDTPAGNQCPAFARIGDVRHGLFRDVSGFILRNGDRVELREVVLLPNRDTRPVCQDAFFNTHTYVAGPAEVRYLGALNDLYAAHGVTPARVQPRMSVTLMDPRTKRLLDRSCLDMDRLMATDSHQLHGLILHHCGNVDMTELQSDAHAAVDSLLNQLTRLELDDPGFRKTVTRGLKELLGKKRADQKNRLSDQIADGEELLRRLKPGGKPQERVFPVFMYMNRHGAMAFLDWLMDKHAFETQNLEIPNGT